MITSASCAAALIGQTIEPPDLVWAAAGHTGGEWSIAFSHDGQTFATSSDDGTIKLWNTADGAFIRSIGAAITGVRQIGFTPDGQHIVGSCDWLPGGGEPEYRMWNVADGQLAGDFGGEGASGMTSVGQFRLSPDGNTLVTAFNYTHSRLWTVPDDGSPLQLDDAGDPIGFSADGTRLVIHIGTFGFPAGLVQVRSAPNWNVVSSFDASAPNGLNFNTAALTLDGQIIATGYNNTADSVKLYGPQGTLLRVLQTVDAYSVLSLAYSPDGQTIVAAGEEDAPFPTHHRMFIFRVNDGQLQGTIAANYGATFVVTYSPNGQQIASAGADDQIHLFDATSGDLIRNFGNRRGGVGGVAFSNDSVLMAAGDSANDTFDGADVELFQAANGQPARRFHGHTDVINAVSFAPDDVVAASGAGSPPPDTVDPSVRLWRVSDGAQLWIAPGHAGGTTSVAFTHDGSQVVTGGRDNRVRVWDRANGTLLHTLSGHMHWVQSVAVSPDGALVASGGGEGTVRIWRASDWSFVRSLSNADWPVNSVSFSPDGQNIAIGGDSYGDNLRIVRVSDGALVRQFAGDPYDFLGQVHYTPDGQRLIASSRDYPPRVWIWNVANGEAETAFEQEMGWLGSSRVDLQACKLEYSIVSPK